MNIDYVVAVTDSIEEFFNDNFELSLKREEMELHETFSNIEDGMFLNLKGNIEGKVVLTYTDQFKEHLAYELVKDFEGPIKDKVLRSEALKEFLNQLSGHIVTKMDEEGYDWDIDVPHFIVNGEPKLDDIQLETIVIPYFNEKIGNIKITIALKELNEIE